MPPRPRHGFKLLLALVVLCAAAKPILYDTLDPDCFWHLRVGQQLREQGVRPLHEELSFASTSAPWTPYSWLAEIGMSRLWDMGGFRAAVLASSLLAGGTMLLIAMACRQAVGGAIDDGPRDAVNAGDRYLPTVLATVFAAILALPYLSFRPVTLAFFLLAGVACLILRDRRWGERTRAVWFVIPVTVLLVNVHLFAALVPMSFAAMLLGAVYERLRLLDPADRHSANRSIARYAVLTLASLLACLMTPVLPGVIATMAHYQWRDPMVASDVIAEMRPFWAGAAGKVSLTLVALFAICVARRHRRLRAGELVWMLFAVALLLRLGRMAPMFAIVAAPLLAVTMPLLSDAVLGRVFLKRAVAAVLCLGAFRVAAAFPDRATDVDQWVNRHGPTTPGYPTEAAQFVAVHVPRKTGHLVNEFNWGGYLAWRLGDQYQVLLDGRTQVFSPEMWRQTYLGGDANRRQFLSHVDADAAVVPIDKSLFRATLVDLGWRPVHRDDRAEVLVPPASHLADINGD